MRYLAVIRVHIENEVLPGVSPGLVGQGTRQELADGAAVDMAVGTNPLPIGGNEAGAVLGNVTRCHSFCRDRTHYATPAPGRDVHLRSEFPR